MVNPTSDIDDSSIINGNDVKKGNGGDLQDRRLIRAFLMGEGKQGWRDAMKLVQKAGQVIEQQDHHPTILITPSSDYSPSSFSLESTVNGYIVEISTHTHTPLPPYPIPTKNHPHKIRPGVTGKDINLAESLEKAWEEVMGGKEKIQIKKE
ncbi:uncharacterized protein L201_003583 [Kwoniella dendrophila CBS 6074]|uniref:4a-hydroxytetrahydrobiopterin dehydratase n=1 Tax=Kwoniella dendrophila CBS 6074 TaxID=1295534 RepID=A0AAX4JVW0_9TREE